MSHHDKLDKALDTRNYCVVGLCLSWFTGIAGVAGGCYCVYLTLDGNTAKFVIPHAAKEVLPLGINIIITFLNESMGYIHSTSLRWSLHSTRSRPNKWYSNIAFLFCIILSYATTSLIFLGWNPALTKTIGSFSIDKDLAGIPANQIEVSGVALVFFGLSLLGQAALSNWALVGTKIPTWSSNPLDTVYACTDDTNPNQLIRRTDRCMKSVHQITEDSRPCVPKWKQGPLCTAHKEVKFVLGGLWFLVPLGGLWGGAIYTMIIRGNPNGVLGGSWTFLPVFTGWLAPPDTCDVARCTDGTSVLNVGWTANTGMAGNIGSIFLIAGFQAGLTLALHCAELLVNLSRDEGIFRMAITPKGTDPRYKSIIAAFCSWQTIMLFVFKAAVHWLFGLSINNDFMLGVNMYPPQIFYFTAFALMVAIFATYVSVRRPVGPLPATFGHLQTMADLIDVWDDRMWWGHKEDGNPNYAGTSATKLRMPRKFELYGGKRAASLESWSDVNGIGVQISMEDLAAAAYHDMVTNGGVYYNGY